MAWVNALSLADVNDFVSESYAFEAKTAQAYTLLMMRLRRVGSLPADDDKSLASIARCTRHFWNTRAWPVLKEIFEVRDGRLFHPGVERAPRAARSAPATDSAPTGETPRQAAARKAANERWGNRTNLSVVTAAENGDRSEAPANRMPDASQPHAERMPDACDLDAESPVISMPTASPDASESHTDASVASGASSLSLSSLISESLKNQEESEREREDARAGTDASEDAPGMRSHPDRIMRSRRGTSRSHHRMPSSDAPAPSRRFPADWVPSPDGEREARRWGYDPGEMAATFRDHYVSTGETRADWDAAFLNWCRRQAGFDGKRQRNLPPMAIQGGAATPAPAQHDDAVQEQVARAEAWAEPPLAAQWGRVRERLRSEAGEVEYRTWMRQMTLAAVDADEVTVNLPTRFLRDWVSRNYGPRLNAFWQAENPAICRVDLSVAPAMVAATRDSPPAMHASG